MSVKVGRNQPCPCGSGKKYKKCCLGKDSIDKRLSQQQRHPISRLALVRHREDLQNNPNLLEKISKETNKHHPNGDFKNFLQEMWDTKKIAAMNTKDIIKKLKFMNIDFQKKRFKKEINNSISAIEVAEQYYYTQNFKAEGPDEDFIWLAISELWKRLYSKKFNVEMIDNAIQDGYKKLMKGYCKEGIRHWETAWNMIKVLGV